MLKNKIPSFKTVNLFHHNSLVVDGSSGFSAHLRGWCERDGAAILIPYAFFWSSKKHNTSSSIFLKLNKKDDEAVLINGDSKAGVSVRCIKK
ncbi:MAG: hypothetical protein B6I20_10745 [Bacteroidetes bacterium 4572_117]|nr:MAG: hypothetical protein B6I20_10745 [Bacteroidetes bacterium 4572_117]